MTTKDDVYRTLRKAAAVFRELARRQRDEIDKQATLIQTMTAMEGESQEAAAKAVGAMYEGVGVLKEMAKECDCCIQWIHDATRGNAAPSVAWVVVALDRNSLVQACCTVHTDEHGRDTSMKLYGRRHPGRRIVAVSSSRSGQMWELDGENVIAVETEPFGVHDEKAPQNPAE